MTLSETPKTGTGNSGSTVAIDDTPVKVGSTVAGMVAGADSIDDLDL